MLVKFLLSNKAATSIEYALIASLVSIGIIGALLLFQGEMGEMFQYISESLNPVFRSED